MKQKRNTFNECKRQNVFRVWFDLHIVPLKYAAI